MTDELGRGSYRVDVDKTKAEASVKALEGGIKKAGTAAEKEFGTRTTGALNKVDAALQKITAKGGLTGAVLGGVGIGAGLGIFSLVQRGIGMVTDALSNATQAAREDALSQAKLNTALAANIDAWDGNTAAIEATLAARMKLGYSDDEQRDSLALLVSVTKDSTEALDLQRTAMDLARLRNMSLADASQLLGKVYSGNLGILSRYGIKLEKGATATEALAEIQKRAAGQAEAWAKQNQKAVADVRIAEAMETLGAKIVPIVDGMTTLAADVLPDVIDFLSDLGDNVAPVVDGALSAISNSIDAIGKSFTALQDLMDPAGTEWERVTRSIREQAEALGLNGDAAVAYTETLKAQARAERERLAIAEQIADIDAATLKLNQDAFDARQSVRTAIDNLVKSQGEAADTTELENELTRINIKLQTDLQPYIAERERLTGDLAAAQKVSTAAVSEDARVHGIASQALDEYNRYLAELKTFEESIPRVFTKSTDAAQEQVSAFETFGTRAADGLRQFVEGAQAAAHAIGPGNPRGVVPALEDTLERMFRDMSEAKDPWKQQWRDLAAWAKDPFSKERFQDYIATRVRQAMRRARESFGAEKQRWLEIARAYRYIAKNEWIDPMKADIEKIMFALRLADRITQAAKDKAGTGGSGGTPGAAYGTLNHRGGTLIVGVHGPELAWLPRGTAVSTAQQTRQAMGTGGEQVVRHIHTADRATVQIARDMGVSLGDVLLAAERDAGSRYSTARG